MKALRGLATALLVASSTACGGGGGSVPAPGASQTPSVGSRIDAVASAQVATGLVPSLEIGVARGGQTIYLHSYGWRSLAPAIAPDANTDYQIASLTKAFTAASVLLLVQDGKLALDDPLSHYIPEYPPATGITLRQMLNMVSGIPSDVNDGFTTLYGPIDHESVVQRLATFPLDFAPGTKFEYANANYYLLGIVVERVSGQTYPQFVTSRVIAPLGLSRTAYLANWNDADTASGYWHNGVPSSAFGDRPPWSADYLFSMGGLLSDAPDLLRWEESLRAPGVLNGASLQTMFTVPNPALSPYAMGWFIDRDGTRWHDGESSGFNTAHALFPDGYDVVVLGNTWDQYPGHFDPVALVQSVHAALPP
ncbi:MAG: serine hydrolase domain-containing protein [Candidatus Elarobacter sp.]